MVKTTIHKLPFAYLILDRSYSTYTKQSNKYSNDKALAIIHVPLLPNKPNTNTAGWVQNAHRFTFVSPIKCWWNLSLWYFSFFHFVQRFSPSRHSVIFLEFFHWRKIMCHNWKFNIYLIRTFWHTLTTPTCNAYMNMYNTTIINNYSHFYHAGGKIAPNTGANATKVLTLATKSWKLVAKLATRSSYHTLPRDLVIVEDL